MPAATAMSPPNTPMTADDREYAEGFLRDWAAGRGVEFLGAEYPEPLATDGLKCPVMEFRPTLRLPDGRAKTVPLRFTDELWADRRAWESYVPHRLAELLPAVR
jgi:hypothetical protein